MDIKKLQVYAIAVVALAVVTLTGIAVIGQFKASSLIDNTTADSFSTGLAIFGSFIGILVIAVIGKMVMALFQKSGGM